MRTKNSLNNIKFNIISQLISFFTKFIGRMIFVKILSSEYLGINGLFSNILTILSLADLGLDSVLIFSMYEPLAKKNENKVKSLINYYKKIYNIISIFILIVGLSLIPFLKYLIKDVSNIPNLNLIYILYLLNTVISYLCIYKISIVNADQKSYIVTINNQIFNIISTILTSIVLIISHNFLLYLLIQIIISIISNIHMSKKAEKLYPYIKKTKGYTITEKEKEEIRKNTFASMLHKIGGVVVIGTDNLIISAMIGLNDVGLYSNYVLIINAINSLSSQFSNSITASVGSLNTENNTEHLYNIFKKTLFINSWIYIFCSVCLYALINPFIAIWIGEEYLFSNIIVLIIIIKFYIEGSRKAIITFRNAMGIFRQDKWKPLLEAILNFIFSIVLTYKYGLPGVFLGTIISMLVSCVFIESFILYKYGFKKNVIEYYKIYAKNIVILSLNLIITSYLVKLFNDISVITFIFKTIVTLIVSNLIIIIFNIKNEEFRYFATKIKDKITLIKKVR